MDSTVLAAFIGGVALVGATWLQGRSTRKAVRAVHDEVKTNDGQRAGERIEALPDVIATGLNDMGQVLADALADHTDSDATNFEELRTMMQQQDSRLAGYVALLRQGQHSQ